MRLILIRGLPGSGKSTLALQLMSSNGLTCAQHFEADQYFMEDGEYNFNVDHLHLAHKWCQDKTRDALQANCDVIVSNTFTTAKELKSYFKIAAEYDIVPQVILCQGSWESVHNVPTEVLVKMKNRFDYDITRLFETLINDKGK